MNHRTRLSMPRTAPAVIAGSFIACAAGMTGCSKADLIVRDIAITDYTATTLSYDFTVENVDYGGATADLPGSIDGRIGFKAHCSTDGVVADGPAAGADMIRPVNPTLLPGEVAVWSHSVNTTVDIDRWPYLVIEVDPDDRIIEHNEKNNTASAPIAP